MDLLQGEVIDRFSRGVRQVGQVCAEIGQQLSGDDKTDVLVDHCIERKMEMSLKGSKLVDEAGCMKRTPVLHTCFDKGLQGLQLLCICQLNGLLQNLPISGEKLHKLLLICASLQKKCRKFDFWCISHQSKQNNPTLTKKQQKKPPLPSFNDRQTAKSFN